MTAPLIINDKLAYLATPYTKYKGGDLPLAFAEACKIAAKLMKSSIKVYSPIAHCHPLSIFGRIDPVDQALWLRFNAKMLEKSDILIVAHMDGWQESYGVGEEIKYFERAGKPIYDMADLSTLMLKRRKPEIARAETSP